MTSTDRRIDQLADALEASGDLSDRRWRRTMHAVPRHLFVPERGYDIGPPEHVIDKAANLDQWWTAVYSDTTPSVGTYGA